MTELAEKVLPSVVDKRTNILHDVAIRMADLNVRAQLEVAIPTLEFLEDIEGKTADDLRRIRDQQKLVDTLSGQDYRDRLQNLFAEKMDALSDKHLEEYHNQLVYEDAVAEVNVQIIPALEELQEELVYGVINKPTLQ